MKTLFIFLTLLFSVLIQELSAQTWIQLTSGYDSTLYDVNFLNQDTGFVCGNNGKILKTTNGGSTWFAQNSGVSEDLSCIQFVNNNVGYASSGFYNQYSTLIKTINGGDTWTTTNVLPLKAGGGMWFLDEDKGFYAYADALYGNSVIVRTLNGGANWDTVHVANGWISFFHFTDTLHGFATVNNGTILKTIDGGLNWSSLSLGQSLWGSGIYFFNKDVGLVGGGPPSAPVSMFKTVNAGANWTTISTSPTMIFKIFFADNNNGYALTVDTTGAGYMIKSTNSGDSWASETTPINNLRGLFFLNNSLGYAVGDDGVILKYTNITGIENSVLKNEALTIYPNPAMNTISIKNNGYSNDVFTMNIYTVFGKLVTSEILNPNNQQKKIGNLSNGIYMVEIKTKELSETQKLIIQR
jgi:photosystem II stability/assembly factor-like uncharacterized protein